MESIEFEYGDQVYSWKGSTLYDSENKPLTEGQGLLIWYHATNGRSPLMFNTPKLYPTQLSYWNDQSIENVERRWKEPLRLFWVLLKVIPDKEQKKISAKEALKFINRIVDSNLTKPLHQKFFKEIQRKLKDFLKPPGDLRHQRAFYIILLKEYGLFTGMASKKEIIAECKKLGFPSEKHVYEQLKRDNHMYKVGARKGRGGSFTDDPEQAKKDFPATYEKALKKFKEDHPDIQIICT